MPRSTLVGYPGSCRDFHGCAGGPTVTLPTTRQSHASLVQSAARAPRARPSLDADGSRRIVEMSAIARRAIRVPGPPALAYSPGTAACSGIRSRGPTGSAGRRRGRLRQRGAGGDRLRRRHRGGRPRSRRVPHRSAGHREKLRMECRTRLGHRRVAAEDDRAVSGHIAAAVSGVLVVMITGQLETRGEV